jgi:predicted CoA-binding protein
VSVPTPGSSPEAVLSASRTVAVVGASGTPGKPACEVPQELLAAGWEVIPVNPAYDELYGRRCYPDLAAVGPVDLVDVFRPPAEAAAVADAAVAAGARALWLQLGITSAPARAAADAAGIAYVEDECTAVVARRPGVRPPAA